MAGTAAVFSKASKYGTSFIEKLGFEPKDGERGVYTKIYSRHGGYIITITLGDMSADLFDGRVDYGFLIACERKTSCNLRQLESLVVLECVDRLLEMGYRPDRITLEKAYRVGHKDAFLDILVTRDDNTAFMMIECKRNFDELDKAVKDLLETGDGSQLISYFMQDRSPQVLTLYASELVRGKRQFKSRVVHTTDLKGRSAREVMTNWKPRTLAEKGVLEPTLSPYVVSSPLITSGGLNDLTDKEGGENIFNEFMTILRIHAVSDKTNAFNKIFNLFVCKIRDEDIHPPARDEVMDFQVKPEDEGEIPASAFHARFAVDLSSKDVSGGLLQRLSILYRDGLDHFLGKGLAPEFFNPNHEFGFIEVHDAESARRNYSILLTTVRLLSKYRFRYTSKQQFLGDFFEQMLNSGIKQESGQYFTPIPLARFICKALPVSDFITAKMRSHSDEWAPRILDYASGSGHFLVEMMDEIQHHLDRLPKSAIDSMADSKRRDFIRRRADFAWASSYVYGIEKDHRLAKTSKINTFLNGDGEANILNGDGLDSFDSDSYKAHLGAYRSRGAKEHGPRDFPICDVVVANPPYSVSGFRKATPGNLDENFALARSIGPETNTIEALFFERTAQVLRDGGAAGIILPVSFLSNDGIHAAARGLLFEEFSVKGLVYCENQTFAATNYGTVIVFLTRLPRGSFLKLTAAARKIIETGNEATLGGVDNACRLFLAKIGFKDKAGFSKWAASVRETDQTIDVASQKLARFASALRQKMAVVQMPDERSEQRRFLGYEFSKSKGQEGIHVLTDPDGFIDSALFSDNPKASGEDKIADVIRKSFKGKLKDGDSDGKGFSKVTTLADIVDWTSESLPINARLLEEDAESAGDGSLLSSLASIKIGGTPSRRVSDYWRDGTLPWASIADLSTAQRNGGILTNTKEKITIAGAESKMRDKLVTANSILLSFKLSIGKSAIAGVDMYTNEAIAAIRSLDEDVVRTRYLYYKFQEMDLSKTAGGGIGKGNLNKDLLGRIRITVPSIAEQDRYIKDKDEKAAKVGAAKAELERLRD